MAVRTETVPPEKVKAPRSSWRSLVRRAGRAGLVIAAGLGLWLAFRWVGGVPPVAVAEPALNQFLADGGGGAIEVWGVYANEEYFRLTRRDPAKLGVNPARELTFLLLIDAHEHDQNLPSPEGWRDGVFLRVDGERDYSPLKKKLVLSSEHHQTVAFAFPNKGSDGRPLLGSKSVLELVVPDVGDGGTRRMEWRLPLASGVLPPPHRGFLPLSLTALLPALAGLLVAFSPCLVHMTTYYIPLFSGVTEPGTARAKTARRMARATGLFALGFAIPYAAAGIAVGYAGQFVKGNSVLVTWSQPLALVAGTVVLFFGLQLAGVFRLPFMLRLNLPLLRSGRKRAGNLAPGLLGMNLALGCLTCVGGTLFASLILYSGVMGSPWQGGLILLLFALAANAPFFLAALTLGHLRLRSPIPLRIARYLPMVSGAFLIALGLLILSGSESLMEDALIQALGIRS